MYKAPRGAADILPGEQAWWRHVERTAAALCERFGYGRIDTPIFESSALFNRSVGEATDIVEKETYTFNDRSSNSMTLRPEGTAAVCRAYLEHGMHVLPKPVRLYSVRAPMFRYDRPQAGRYRQFHQVNCEAIGDGTVTVDVEVIELAWRLFQNLGLSDLSLSINSIGDPACRPAYLDALRAYYQGHLESLCADCKKRFHTNPLRLLDCKKPVCQPFAQDAPRSADMLCQPCQDHWRQLQDGLITLDIPFTVDHRLVRGLDYYTRTVFEVQPPEEGGQSAIGGGGRYDGLIEQLGGHPTPAVGFACGIERLILNLKRQGIVPPTESAAFAIVACMGDNARPVALKLASDLRKAGIRALLAPSGKSLKAQMRYIDAAGATHALILGDDELLLGAVTIKVMSTGDQRQAPITHAAQSLLQP